MKLAFDTIFGFINIDYLIIGFGVCVILYYLFLDKPKKIVIKETYVDTTEQVKHTCPCMKKQKSKTSKSAS
jgi:hypothetical protein